MSKLITSSITLDELMEIAEQYEQEDNTEEIPKGAETHLAIYTTNLVADKVDAVAWFIEKEKNSIEADKQFITDLKVRVAKREKAWEKMKFFVANVLFKHGKDTNDRLNGNANALWYNNTIVVKDDPGTFNIIPDNFKKITLTIPYKVYREYGHIPVMGSTKIEIEKTALKAAIEEGLVKPEGIIEERHHLKIGKSNRKNREE